MNVTDTTTVNPSHLNNNKKHQNGDHPRSGDDNNDIVRNGGVVEDVAQLPMNGHNSTTTTTTSTTTPTPTTSSSTTTTKTTVLRIAVGSANPCKLHAIQQALERAIVNRRCTDNNNGQTQTTQANYQLDIQGFDVESGVSHQPFGDEETRTGAKNRAMAAYKAYRIQQQGIAPHMAIAIEGGLEWMIVGTDPVTNHNHTTAATNTTNTTDGRQNHYLYCMGWIAIYGKRTATTVQALASNETQSYIGDTKPIYGLSKTAMFPLPSSICQLVKEGMELGHADDIVFHRVMSKHNSGTVGKLTDNIIDRDAYYEHAILLALGPWIHPTLFPHGIS